MANIPVRDLDAEFKRDRWGHNGWLGRQHYSRLIYITHAKGYVMARRPGARPFVITDKLWRSFEFYAKGMDNR